MIGNKPAVGTEVRSNTGRVGRVVEPRTSAQPEDRVSVRWGNGFVRETLVSHLEEVGSRV